MIFSLVIPTWNRREALSAALDSLRGLRFNRGEFEVLVVDDGSDDGTRELLGSVSDLPLRAFRQQRQGAGAARNRGIREASGEFCLFVDDDVLPCPDLLTLHLERHRSRERMLVRGPVINIPSLPAPQSPGPLWPHFSMNYLCTSNASLRRELLFEAGLFDERFSRWEDAELGVRLKRIGVRRSFDLKAYVFHYKPALSPEQVLETARRDGISAAQLYRRYPSLAMRLRSGLHGVNFLRSEMLNHPWCRRVLGSPLSWRAEREYLRAGRIELRR